MKFGRSYQFAIFATLITVYIALRFWHLADSCLWFDEIFSVHAAVHPWNEILSFVALDLVHPPLFYLLLKLWIGVGGESIFWLRAFSVLFSAISIFPLIAFQRELKLNRSIQAISLCLLLVNGSLLKYSQEVRMYSLLMCLALFSMWLFARYFIKGKSLIPLIIVNVLLLYTHYFGWCIIMTEIAAVVIFQRIKWRPMLVMFAVAVVSFAPWMFSVYQASHQSEGLKQNIGWTLRPGIIDIVKFILSLIEPFYYPPSTIDPFSVYRISIPLILISVIVLVIYTVDWKLRSDVETRAVKLLAIFAVLPVIAAFAASWVLPQSIWGTRHLIFVFAPVSILVAIAITNLASVKLRAAVLTMVFLFCGYGFVLYAAQERPLYVWCAWGKLAEENISEPVNLNQKQKIYVFENLVAYHLWFDVRLRSTYEVSVMRGIDGMLEDPGYFMPRGFDTIKITSVDSITDAQFWIAFREPNRPEFADGRSHEPLVTLQNKGFVPKETHKLVVGREIVYLTLMSKK
jgi:hypothetical protein